MIEKSSAHSARAFSSGKYVRNDKKSVRKGTPLRTRHSKTAMQLKQRFQIKTQSIFTVSKHYYPITTTSFCPCAKVYLVAVKRFCHLSLSENVTILFLDKMTSCIVIYRRCF